MFHSNPRHPADSVSDAVNALSNRAWHGRFVSAPVTGWGNAGSDHAGHRPGALSMRWQGPMDAVMPDPQVIWYWQQKNPGSGVNNSQPPFHRWLPIEHPDDAEYSYLDLPLKNVGGRTGHPHRCPASRPLNQEAPSRQFYSYPV